MKNAPSVGPMVPYPHRAGAHGMRAQGGSTGEDLGSRVLRIWGPTPSRERGQFCGLYRKEDPRRRRGRERRRGKEEKEEKEERKMGREIFTSAWGSLGSISFPGFLKPFYFFMIFFL